MVGPAGTRAFVEAQMEAWRFDLERRIRHECRPSTVALEVEVEEVAHGDRLAVGGIDVEVVEVDPHVPVVPALGFVFRAGGRAAALSGDTRFCPALIEAARGADLLVHEVFIHREMKPVKGVRTTENRARRSLVTTPPRARSGRWQPRRGSAPWALTPFRAAGLRRPGA